MRICRAVGIWSHPFVSLLLLGNYWQSLSIVLSFRLQFSIREISDKAGWLGPLADLLEEEIILPGESRDNSATVGRGGAAEKPKSWAYLPPRSPTTSTTSSDSYKVTLIPIQGFVLKNLRIRY